MLLVFTAAVLLSAAMMFILEPMFARMVLPSLGGSPAVWNTALVFYQIALLAGYGYVHWSTTRLRARHQAFLHLALLVAALFCLPISLPAGWHPPSGTQPLTWLLMVLVVALGLPFVAVSTTGPLMQKWFAATSHRLAPDPYFLYAASNLGSVLGLLAYPLVIEPRLHLVDQTRLWSWGYAVLAALVIGCAFAARRLAGSASAPSLASDAAAPSISASSLPIGRRLRWALLAFAPSSLMMGATTHITTDIAAVPLLWVLPLAVYLVSFILVFARRSLLPHAFWARALPLLVLPLMIIMLGRPAHPIVPIIGLHLAVLFVAAMVCHGELARDRPPAEHLTGFYLWLALGGALGGIFNAIIAPLAFKSVLEYPLVIALACMLAPARSTGVVTPRVRVLDVLLPIAIGSVPVLMVLLLKSLGVEPTRLLIVLTAGLLAFPLLSLSRRPLRFGLAIGVVLLSNPIEVAQGARDLIAERSFFGLSRVQSDPVRGLHSLYHGTTLHGVQRYRPQLCDDPLGYYGRSGPLGDVFNDIGGPGGIRSVAVAGLGAGAIAAYARPGQRWRFFEIDPAVNRIASDPRFFCYLQNAHADLQVVLGDARLSLTESKDRFDLIVLDAYSSDAIPVHLLTREALALYQSRLTEHGVLVFHVSNQYFRLAPVVARLAGDAGWLCWVRNSGRLDARDQAQGLVPSHYAVVARRPADVGALAHDERWKPVEPGTAPVWTDDYSSLFSVLRTQ